MKKFLTIAMTLALASIATAQIPYFGSSTGKGNLYTYFQIKTYPGNNANTLYTAEAYGLTDNIDLDVNFNQADASLGFGGKYSFYQSHHINVALQPMLTLNMADKFNTYYLCTGLFANGYAVGKFSYILNTWHTWYFEDNSQYLEEWYYLGYDLGPVTILAGGVTDFINDGGSDLAAGFWFPVSKAKKSYAYVWVGNLTKHQGEIKFTVGIDYKF